jgi:hypothetical protein
MTAIPNLYLKWRAFRELADVNDPDNWIGNHVFKTDDGAQRFSKLLRGDLGCSPVIAQDLTRFMNDWIGVARSRAATAASDGAGSAPALEPADLELPVLSFVIRLLTALGDAASRHLDRAHQALLRDMTLELPRGQDRPRLVVERFSTSRSFGADVQPSGGSGPLVFEVGKHKGQLAVIAAKGTPMAAYTFFTRDPAPIGKHLWDLSWGEALLWLPAPIVPTLSDGRLLLLRQAEPVNPMPGRFIVTCALVWQKEAIARLDPRGATPPAGIMDEAETSRFLTNLRRLTEDKLKKWTGAVSVAQAEYIVKA